MQFSVSNAKPFSQLSDCAVVGVYQDNTLTTAAKAFDQASGGYIRRLLKDNWFGGKVGDALWLPKIDGSRCKSVLLVGCGQEKKRSALSFKKSVQKMAQVLKEKRCESALCFLTEVVPADKDMQWVAQSIVEEVESAYYQFEQCKSKSKKPKHVLKKMVLGLPAHKDRKACQDGLKMGQAVSKGKKLAKDLANLPGNICTPTYLADQAKSMAKGVRVLSVTVMEEAAMKRQKMGALLSVSAGSRQPAKLITLQYKNGKKNDRPYVLVGKGVTFDSGGISIKPSAAMDEMKYDMCGAASVLGTMRAVIELGLKINLVGIIPSTENMPDGLATKPGDIVTSMSGQTIEVINTDAEGRLILCDALTYAGKFKPKTVIDIATLTGACVIALGKHPSGVMGNDEKLIGDLQQAGTASGDRVWELPLWEEYQEQINSPFADMANVGGREAGTITAGCFLSRFTEKYKWAHLDIACTAWNSGGNKGATGRPVPLLVQYLAAQSK